MEDIVLDQNNNLAFTNGDLAIGESTLQDVSIILQMNQGELKSLPVLGANLVQLLKSKEKEALIEERVRVHLALDGKDYRKMKEYLRYTSLRK